MKPANEIASSLTTPEHIERIRKERKDQSNLENSRRQIVANFETRKDAYYEFFEKYVTSETAEAFKQATEMYSQYAHIDSLFIGMVLSIIRPVELPKLSMEEEAILLLQVRGQEMLEAELRDTYGDLHAALTTTT